MTFSDDSCGFRFACADAKMSIGASTWASRLSQLGKASEEIPILTHSLSDIDYITNILDKRPIDIWILAHVSAEREARVMKAKLPRLGIALRREIGAKAVLVAPETVWISSSDFGKAGKLESAVVLEVPRGLDCLGFS